jgi:GNAT superfamily N-acetyltransferase
MFWQAVSAGDQSAPEPGLAHLSQIFVLRDQWGSGVAAELLTGAVGEARRRGYERMRLFTPRDHGRARRFYEREGWRPTGEKRFGPELGLQIVEYAIDL